MIGMAEVLDMGGTPSETAALAMVMFATAATPHGKAAGRKYAGEVSKHMLDAASAGGFKFAAEFRRLVDAGRLTRRLEDLAADVVICIGGAEKFFELLELVTTPSTMMGGVQ